MRRVTAILLQQKNFGPNVVYYVLGTQLLWAKTCYDLHKLGLLGTLRGRPVIASPKPIRTNSRVSKPIKKIIKSGNAAMW